MPTSIRLEVELSFDPAAIWDLRIETGLLRGEGGVARLEGARTMDHEGDDMTETEERAARRALELRVAEVVEAVDHPNADRLLVLRIDLGSGERRQLVAGLAGVYEPEELVGKRIVVVANLKAAKLRGEVSEGMLLAAHGEDRVGLLLAPDAAPGTPVETGRSPAAQPAESPESPESPEPAQITIDDFAAHEIRASPDGVTVDGHRVERPRLVVDRDAWGAVR